MTEGITWVRLDAHKVSISVAMLLPGRGQPMEWQIANQPAVVRRLARKLVRESTGEVRCCYEAGPCGYALQRQLLAEDVVCEVVAPSLIPVKPGDHIKTDRRDAKKLAELFRAGLLTEVQPPTEEEESARDLCRGREDAVEDRARSRHRLLKMLLRRGLAYPGKRPWNRGHEEWLRSIRFERAAEQAVFEDYQLAILQVDERIKTLEERLTKLACEELYRAPVGWLRCFHGIDTIAAMTLVTELHGVERFHTARQMMAVLATNVIRCVDGVRRPRGRPPSFRPRAGRGHVSRPGRADRRKCALATTADCRRAQAHRPRPVDSLAALHNCSRCAYGASLA